MDTDIKLLPTLTRLRDDFLATVSDNHLDSHKNNNTPYETATFVMNCFLMWFEDKYRIRKSSVRGMRNRIEQLADGLGLTIKKTKSGTWYYYENGTWLPIGNDSYSAVTILEKWIRAKKELSEMKRVKRKERNYFEKPL